MSLTYSISVALLASVAVAHMVVMPEEISPGGRQTFGVTISHDCGDDTLGTTNFTVEVPRGLLSVKVEDLPGWHVIIHKYTVRVSSTSRPRAAAVHFAHSLNRRAAAYWPTNSVFQLEHPVTLGKTTHNESIHAVEFHGFLADDRYKTFGIKAQAPEDAEVGTNYYWNGYQGKASAVALRKRHSCPGSAVRQTLIQLVFGVLSRLTFQSATEMECLRGQISSRPITLSRRGQLL
jgi:uncharacterized protein YcnI